MVELILTIILFLSVALAGIIILSKIPVLLKLPETSLSGSWFSPVASVIKKMAGKVPLLEKFNYEFYLQKILSRIRILTLKTESKTGNWLERLRHRINQRNNGNASGNDHYWDDLKKAKNGK